jgi:hypothetical protein
LKNFFDLVKMKCNVMATTGVSSGNEREFRARIRRPAAVAQPGSQGRARRGDLGGLVMVAVTFLGLMAITFFIGRIIPIDPVLSSWATGRARKPMTRCGSRWVSTSR